MVDVVEILKHTPIWVWFLFAFLIYRGIAALKKRSLTLSRLLVLPILFFVWAVLSIWGELHTKSYGFTAFVTGLVLGGIVGWLLWRDGSTYNCSTHLFERNGSVWTLVLVLLAFVSKFALSVKLGYTPTLATDSRFCMLFGGTSGLFDGIFWGGTVLLLQKKWKS